MVHSLAKRLHDDEKQVRAVLESTLIQYGAMLGVILLLVFVCVCVLYYTY